MSPAVKTIHEREMEEKKKLLARHNVNEQSFDIVALHRPKVYTVESRPKKMCFTVCSRFYPAIKGKHGSRCLVQG